MKIVNRETDQEDVRIPHTHTDCIPDRTATDIYSMCVYTGV